MLVRDSDKKNQGKEEEIEKELKGIQIEEEVAGKLGGLLGKGQSWGQGKEGWSPSLAGKHSTRGER